MVLLEDILRGASSNEESEHIKVKELMTKDVYRVSRKENLDKVVFTMSDKKIGSAIIEDTDDDFFGIFTSTDALNISRNHREIYHSIRPLSCLFLLLFVFS